MSVNKQNNNTSASVNHQRPDLNKIRNTKADTADYKSDRVSRSPMKQERFALPAPGCLVRTGQRFELGGVCCRIDDPLAR